MRNTRRRWTFSSPCRWATGARRRSSGTTRCASTRCRPDMKVGFIGIGNIGAPIAGQLLRAGHSLIVHDLRREAAEALVSAGASWSDSVAAIAGECEVVATCLPGPAQMEQGWL